MSVTYSFSTTLILPTGDEFTCMDVGEASMPLILTFPEVTASRGSPWFSIDSYDDLVITSDDGASSSLEFDLSLQPDHTFETTFKPSALPEDLSKLDLYRFFIGTYDQQDNAGGILLSKSGIALLASFGTSALVLPGSQDLLTEGETYYTLRLVVEGTSDTMYLYLTKTSDLPLTGHQLRYTTAAPSTPSGVPDSIRVEIIGQSTRAVVGKFSSFRACCNQALVPNRRPIADAGNDQTANVGSAVTYDGMASYDPERAPLTYKWSLVDAPEVSRYRISGTDGSTSDDGDVDGFTDIFNGGTDVFSEDNAPLLQPGDALLVEGTVYEVSTDRWTLNTSTGKYERDTLTWDDDEIVITTDTLPDDLSGVAWDVFHSATFFNDRTQPTTSAIPDISGLYYVQLVVNDGSLDSLPTTVLLNVSQTSVALGCIPDLSWIWNLLGDFWNLLEDREIIETFWSGFAQAAAAQLLTAWQIDYNKSLIDIQRVFQRRWLGYDTRDIDDPTTASVRIIRGPIFSSDLAAGANVDGLTLQLVLDASAVQIVTFSGANPISLSDIVDQINEQMGFGTAATKLAAAVTKGASQYLTLDYALLLRIRPGGTANSTLGFSATEYTQNDLRGSLGSALSPTRLTSFEATDPPVLDFDEQGVVAGDLLVTYGQGYVIVKTAAESASPYTEMRGLTLESDLPDPTDPITPPGPWIIPSIVVSEEIDFESRLVMPGDIARFEVKLRTTRTTREVACEVVAVNGYGLGFDPAPLLESYAGSPNLYETRFLGTKHVKYIPVDDLVLEIPRLQQTIKDPPSTLAQNVDYVIEKVGDQNAISLSSGTFTYLDPPPDILWAEITYLDNRPTIEANFGRMVNFTIEGLETRTDDLDYLSAVRGLWWAYFGGPSLYKVKVGAQILLGLPFSEADGMITSVEPNFSATEGRIIIQDTYQTNIVRTYYYPLAAGLATNDATGLPYVEGDTVAMFAPLSGGVEVEDWVSDPAWLQSYVAQHQMLELDKYFRFLIRADVDTFNLTNLIFAQDFVKKIKPAYTWPLFVMLKKLPTTEVDVADTITMKVKLALSDTFCSRIESGSYRWDDTDESGNWTHQYDPVTPPPAWIHDTHRLCPDDLLWVAISYIHPGGAGWFFDTIWSYDDGDTDGDLVSEDKVPLSGPDSLSPAPYGPLVGVITHDAAVTAGTYHRERWMK